MQESAIVPPPETITDPRTRRKKQARKGRGRREIQPRCSIQGVPRGSFTLSTALGFTGQAIFPVELRIISRLYVTRSSLVWISLSDREGKRLSFDSVNYERRTLSLFRIAIRKEPRRFAICERLIFIRTIPLPMIPGDYSFLTDHDLLSIERNFSFTDAAFSSRRSKLEHVRYDWSEAGFLLDIYTIKRSTGAGFNVPRSKVPRRGLLRFSISGAG